MHEYNPFKEKKHFFLILFRIKLKFFFFNKVETFLALKAFKGRYEDYTWCYGGI